MKTKLDLITKCVTEDKRFKFTKPGAFAGGHRGTVLLCYASNYILLDCSKVVICQGARGRKVEHRVSVLLCFFEITFLILLIRVIACQEA